MVSGPPGNNEELALNLLKGDESDRVVAVVVKIGKDGGEAYSVFCSADMAYSLRIAALEHGAWILHSEDH
jgi:hypothetical protein